MKRNRILALVLALVMLVGLVPVTAQAAALECQPYANVQYDYCEDVSVGTIRYIRQMPDRDYFYEDYWPEEPFGGYSSPKNECGTAVISMALSYVGVNKTPKAILEANNGYTYFTGWGPELQKPDSVAQGMERYISGEGKFSPVIIHLDDYTGRGHYVILAGRVSENVYIAVDPVKDYTWEITVDGLYCEYLGQSDYIDEIAQYYNPDAVMEEPPVEEPPEEEPPVEEHECDRGEYLYYYAQHPHYSVYRCSLCGDIWADLSSGNLMEGCEECINPLPNLYGLDETYTFEDAVCFYWDEVPEAARYSLSVEGRTEEGWAVLEPLDPVEQGVALGFYPGEYRVRITAHSALCPEDEAGCIDGEYHYFTVVESWPNPFVDVAEGSYYYDCAIWAYYNGITSGDGSADTFNPTGKCTRGQVVTFLWRMAGSPEPQSDSNPFKDVAEGKFYAKAARWAAEQGITSGVDATHFAPNQTCTRGQVVTFLWRAAGKPEPQSQSHGFADLRSGAFYGDAVLWAVENGITSGMTSTTFEPESTCTRAQVVTFLYRSAEE